MAQMKNSHSVLFAVLMFVAAGCEINDFTAEPNAEYQESFLYVKSAGGRSELLVSNINGNVTVIGIDTLSEIRISGTKIVKDQTVDDARRHIGEIEIDILETGSTLSVRTLQPGTGSGRTYQVNYEVMVPAAWKVTVSDVNGNIDIQNIRNAVTASVVNGNVNATDIAGSTNVNVTNGTINAKVFLPENGSCALNLVNGNILLLVPRTLSASVSASVTIGTVSVTNLPMTYTTNSRTVVAGSVGGGKGTVRISSVNGVVQLVGI